MVYKCGINRQRDAFSRIKRSPANLSLSEARKDSTTPDSTPEAARSKTHRATDHASSTRRDANGSEMHVVDHIAHHINTKDCISYIVC